MMHHSQALSTNTHLLMTVNTWASTNPADKQAFANAIKRLFIFQRANALLELTDLLLFGDTKRRGMTWRMMWLSKTESAVAA